MTREIVIVLLLVKSSAGRKAIKTPVNLKELRRTPSPGLQAKDSAFQLTNLENTLDLVGFL